MANLKTTVTTSTISVLTDVGPPRSRLPVLNLANPALYTGVAVKHSEL